MASDLPARFGSAVVMLVVAAAALWLGGKVWMIFIVVLALGVLWEWTQLSWRFVPSVVGRMSWSAAGLLYVACGSSVLITSRQNPVDGLINLSWLILMIMAVDVGAYAAGRTFGGPKIAPKISPSKTWAGLGGAVVGAMLIGSLVPRLIYDGPHDPWQRWQAGLADSSLREFLLWGVLIGPLFAIIAQAGDFFESWMKRRAGVKDSGNLIPGHGGLFDRVDGLLAVLFVPGLFDLIAIVFPQSR